MRQSNRRPRDSEVTRRRPRIAGTGLIALDIVCSPDDPQPSVFAGGTCGNVLTILSYLGWTSFPIARLADDTAGGIVKSDMRAWGINTSLLSLRPPAKTPIVVEKIRRDRNRIPFHTFSFHCPSCGRRFPGFQPVTASSIDPAKLIVESADVFFVDRVSRSSVLLAQLASKAGKTVVFEPPSTGGARLFEEMMRIAHVIKYSHERIDELPISATSPPAIEIQSLGRGGLRFRLRGMGRAASWHHLQAEPVQQLVDSAGAGDWLTAGFLYNLFRIPHFSIERLNHKELVSSLSVGQRLAAWNCGHTGARGGMYSGKKSEITALIAKTYSSGRRVLPVIEDTRRDMTCFKLVCVNCMEGQALLPEENRLKMASA